MGAAEARMFAREGAMVVIGDILNDEGTALAAEITGSGAQALFVHLDVTDEEGWRSAVEAALTAFGKLDVLVNNAGIWRGGRVEDHTAEVWDTVLDVNAKGVFLGTKVAIPEMRKAGGGSIVNISSTGGLVGSLRGAATAYIASKGAVRLFTKATAVQYAWEGIRANSVHPGAVDTEMYQQVSDSFDPNDTGLRLRNPTGRIATPEDVAYGVLFLASDESSFITGSELVIDGGGTAQ